MHTDDKNQRGKMMPSETMRVVIVTSDVTYVPDNYRYLFDQVTDPRRLPPAVEVVGAVLLRIPAPLVLKNSVGLPIIGAPGVGLALARNFMRARLGDPRVALLESRGIPIWRASSVNLPETLAWLRARAPDLIINARTRNIYKDPVLALPTIGCINIHHGLLPDHRGTMCDLYAWTAGRPAGFSIHWMNAKIDDGALLCRREVPTAGLRSYVDLVQRSSRLEAESLLACLAAIKQHGRKIGWANVAAEKKPHTRNPGPSQILAWRRQGFHL
jgi:methionyl-tRNA formyltransferase